MSLASVKQSIPLRPRTLDRAEYERYQPLVRRIAMRLARRVPKTISMSDLVSCGWLGLMEAFTRAAPEMPGEEFEAYASYRIRGAMMDALRSGDSFTRYRRQIARRIQAAGLPAPTRLNLAKSVLLQDRARLIRALEQRYRLLETPEAEIRPRQRVDGGRRGPSLRRGS
jgi:RNA polymerase sigma factor for flagellar operon FliA